MGFSVNTWARYTVVTSRQQQRPSPGGVDAFGLNLTYGSVCLRLVILIGLLCRSATDMSSRIRIAFESKKPPARTSAEGFVGLGLMNRAGLTRPKSVNQRVMLCSTLMLDIIDVIPVEGDNLDSILVFVWMSSTCEVNRRSGGVKCTIPDCARC
jgi:hypothetical protein